MNINGQPLSDCTDEELRAALDGIYSGLNGEIRAQAKAIEQELERRAASTETPRASERS